MATIAAIPTLYAGVMFRSRLEARWAATLDLWGVAWEYEPFDLDGYIPDFRMEVLEPGTRRRQKALAEVKPVDDIQHFLKSADAAKMAAAINRLKSSDDWPNLFNGVLLILGLEGAAWLRDRNYTPEWPEEWGPVNIFRKVWREAGNKVQWRHPPHNP